MTYALETDHKQLETTFDAIKTFGFWQPQATITPGDFAPIIRRSSSPLLAPFELTLLRYGLVPPGFTSARDRIATGCTRYAPNALVGNARSASCSVQGIAVSYQ